MRICLLLIGLCVVVAERRFVLGPATQYRVTVVTADENHANTHSHVFISMTGVHGVTREIQLNTDDHTHYFTKGKVDQFLVTGSSVGNLTSIRVRHDTHHDSSWKLDKITIEDGEGIYEFPCDCWLDKRHNDGTLSQTIPLGAYHPAK